MEPDNTHILTGGTPRSDEVETWYPGSWIARWSRANRRDAAASTSSSLSFCFLQS